MMFTGRNGRYQTRDAPTDRSPQRRRAVMASGSVVLLAALGAAVYFSCLGAALVRWIRPVWAPVAGIGPMLGWAVFSALAFPFQSLFGFGPASTAVLAGLALGASVATLVLTQRRSATTVAARLPRWAYLLAGLIALVPLAAVLPKHTAEGVILATPMFDHSKAAIVDEIRRLGLPAGNAFFGAGGARGSLSYYFLWHFGAAQLSVLSGASGWEADAALTGFTGYASVLMTMGLAGRLATLSGVAARPSPRRRAGPVRPAVAMAWAALISLTGSLRPLLIHLAGDAQARRMVARYPSLAGWVVQASWVPQHVASACCVVLAALMIVELAERRRASVVLTLGALVAAGFGSSAWVGGVTFAAAAVGLGVTGLVWTRRGGRLGFLIAAAAAAGVAVVLALPFLRAEFSTLLARHDTTPISFHAYEVLGAVVPQALRRPLDYPAYWLVLLPLDLPAVYVAGMVAMGLSLRRTFAGAGRNPLSPALAMLALVSLGTTWLFASTIANNDLGWRAMLPGVFVLTAFAGAGLARWIGLKAWGAVAGAVLLFALSVPDRQILLNVNGYPSPEARRFVDAASMWSAVRRYAGPGDRVGDNPLFLMTLTAHPVNPSWALLSDRPSCYSGWETARAYVDLPDARIRALDDQFIRVFGGRGTPDDVRQMAQDYGCRVIALAASDGSWIKDPFAVSPYYRLAETRTGAWRIYVATTPKAAAPPR